MHKDVVVRFFKTQRQVARALGISDQAVSLWGDVIPEKNALRLHQITNGELLYDESMYRTADGEHATTDSIAHPLQQHVV